MASASGLSRRRVATSSSTTSSVTSDSESTGSPSNSHPPTTTSTVHAGSAFAGGSKIAFDPKDAQLEDEHARLGGKLPRLTILEDVLLLGLKDKQGYLSFWNDNISYALRGCILIELALRRRIAVVRDASRRQLPVAERMVEVIDSRQTGETILDEALRMMKGQADLGEKLAINTWIDLLSGETWNVMKIGFQLKQVRERLAKGLVDKGVLRTEKKNFLLFDMATHPVADVRAKEGVVSRVVSLLTASTAAVPPSALGKEGTQCRVLRAICLVCAAHAASVLDNAFGRLSYEEREAAFQRCDDILGDFATWPFGGSAGGVTSSSSPSSSLPSSSRGSRRREGARIGMGGGGGVTGREAVIGLVEEVKKEASGEEDPCFEVVAGVLEVLSKLDSLL